MPTKFKTVTSDIDNWFNHQWPDDPYNHYHFKVRVVVFPDIPARDEMFDFIRDIGMTKIDDVLAKKPLNAERVMFVFPDRWMTQKEQQGFTYLLNQNPSALDGTLKYVDIYTNSPLIVSGFSREQIRIISKEDAPKNDQTS